MLTCSSVLFKQLAKTKISNRQSQI